MKIKRSRVDREGRFRPLPRSGTGVQLLLIQSVDHVGKQGDVVTVKRGYALNYLLPQGLATVATDHHKRMVEKHRSRLQEIEKARLASLRQLAEAIAKQSVTIEANARVENAAIVRADMVRSCKEIPDKALKGYIQGENYIVPLRRL